jgi:hypothetical protein
MESLYDALRLQDPNHKEKAPEPWYDKPLTAKQFADLVTNSREFRQYILNGILLGTLPQTVMCRILDHSWGQPVKRVEFEDKTPPLDGLTMEQLEARIARLSMLVREIKQTKPLEPDSDSTTQVH